jgi:hypothetical protein
LALFAMARFLMTRFVIVNLPRPEIGAIRARK